MVKAHWQAMALIEVGGALQTVPSATVEVRAAISGTPLVNLWSDRDGATPLTNPFTADSDGKVDFFVDGGIYNITVSDSESPPNETIWEYEGIGTAQEVDVSDLFDEMGLGDAALKTVGTDDGELPEAETVDLIGNGLVTITDAASTTFDADDGITKEARLAATGNRTLTAPTNASVDRQKVIIEHYASGGARTLALTTGSAGAFRFTSDVTALSATSSGKADLIGVRYHEADDRWDVIAYTKGVG